MDLNESASATKSEICISWGLVWPISETPLNYSPTMSKLNTICVSQLSQCHGDITLTMCASQPTLTATVWVCFLAPTGKQPGIHYRHSEPHMPCLTASAW